MRTGQLTMVRTLIHGASCGCPVPRPAFVSTLSNQTEIWPSGPVIDLSMVMNSSSPVSYGHSVVYAAEEAVNAVAPGTSPSRSMPVQVAGLAGDETSLDSGDETPMIWSRRVIRARMVGAAGR